MKDVMIVNGAGAAPSQTPIEAILKGTSVLLKEVGKIIAPGGAGVTISSQSGWRMPALTAEEAELLMGPAGAFISGPTFLIDGGATASYFYGPLKPQE